MRLLPFHLALGLTGWSSLRWAHTVSEVMYFFFYFFLKTLNDDNNCRPQRRGVTRLRIFSLTLRGATSQALTASSRVMPSVHLPQMYRILSLGWTLPSSLAGEPGTTSRQ